MTTVIDAITNFWQLASAIAIGVGSVITWTVRHKQSRSKAKAEAEKLKASSEGLMEDQLEKLKKALILQVQRELEQATTVAELNHIIDVFKLHYPENYESVMTKIYPHGAR